MQIIDGKLVAKTTREFIKKEVELLHNNNDSKIGLAIILIGDNSASEIYVRNKIKACEELGINSYNYHLNSNTPEEEVFSLIDRLNNDSNVNGIILQLPLPKHYDEFKLLDRINPEKDVDGCHYISKGLFWTGRDSMLACTPLGVIRMLQFYNIKLDGLNAVVIGRSNLVGKPLAQLLMDQNCTVTICHTKTKNIKQITNNADLICVAIGQPKFLKEDMVKEGAIVIDIGISRDETGKISGDVDFDNVSKKCSYISPVPGGVGPMTVTMLLYNTVIAYKKQNKIE